NFELIMAITLTEIQALINYIEYHTGKKYQAPSDFEKLAGDIFNYTKHHISVSTIKRLWGYIPRRKQVRRSTLDILALYVNYKDFNDYQSKQAKGINSGYLNSQTILSAGLEPGNILEIGWEPNRICQLLYQGDNYYHLISAQNTRLEIGRFFRIAIFSI